MKKVMVVLLAATLLTSVAPAFAMEHGMSHDTADAQCAKECEMLLKNCAQEVDSIKQRITKLKAAIKKDGADQQKLEDLKVLKQKLAESDALLKSLEKPGR